MNLRRRRRPSSPLPRETDHALPRATRGSKTGNSHSRRKRKPDGPRSQSHPRLHTTVDMLPEDALLEIFDFYRLDVMEPWDHSWPWHTLVHVCRRWRAIVFASSRRLDLRLLCKHGTPVRHVLDYWPPLPIIVNYWNDVPPPPRDEVNIVAALTHPDRVCRVEVIAAASLLEKLALPMQRPFPALTHVRLWSNNAPETVPALSGKFLGGSAPRLQSLSLSAIPFPALPSILPSATDLVSLRLLEMCSTGYIPPDTMVTCLSALTRLEWLAIGLFRAPLPDRGRSRPHPLTRAVLPSLTRFHFRGACEYLDDFVARIDAPLLDHFGATVFNQPVIELPHLSQFILRTGGAHHAFPNEAMVHSRGGTVFVTLYRLDGANGDGTRQQFRLGVSHSEWQDWQISPLEQMCNKCLPPLIVAGIERLYINAGFTLHGYSDEGNDPYPWLAVLHPFKSVRNLYVSETVAPHVAMALKYGALCIVADVFVTELLPVLRMIRLAAPRDGNFTSTERFVDVRQRSGHPVTVFHRRRRVR